MDAVCAGVRAVNKMPETMILIVEDEILLARSLAALLLEFGYERVGITDSTEGARPRVSANQRGTLKDSGGFAGALSDCAA